jgi:Zn2+/Cd2+-exporting ATPase
MAKIISKPKDIITFISIALILVGFIYGQFGDIFIKNLALILATGIAAIPIFLKAIQALRMKAFSIELLVSIAIVGGLSIQEYSETAIVSFLFLFGNYLEVRTLEKTRSSLKELVEKTPQEAIVFRNGEYISIPIEDVEKGDRVRIRSGSKVPVDGIIATGHALLIEAAITGESVPVWKKEEEKVYCGTILDNGYLEVIAEKVGDDTTFAKIIQLVEEAQESKTKIERFLDKFASYYTPAVVLLSIIVFAITKNLNQSITFLVVACPGALVIGAPVSAIAGIGNGAKKGVIVKGGEIMDKFSKVDTIVFDKTGTLTEGKPQVIAMKVFDHLDDNELLRLAAIAETISEHPLGQTIVKEAKSRKLNLDGELESAEIIKGNGIRVKMNEQELVVGNQKLLSSEHIEISEEAAYYAVNQAKKGSTAIFVAVDGSLAGIISVADKLREDAHKALDELRKNGIKRMVMLTGDNKHTAKLVAQDLGLDEYHAELLPKQKVDYVQKLKEDGHVVAMAGDGINDAPAIAAADIGLAMGKGGTEISMETADIVLMSDQLLQFSHAYALSKATINNMKQNTYFAIATAMILLLGVLLGSVHLASGMFIHEGSVLFVILNAMRLIKFKLKNGTIIMESIKPEKHNNKLIKNIS